jgi:hypothetical protein
LDGNDNPGRSRKYKLAIIDEAAAAPNLKNAWEQAIRPTLADLEGSAWFLSTPKGLNHFHDLYARGLKPDSDWKSWQMPSATNPYLPPAEIEAARRELPRLVFEQEFLARFIQADGSVMRNVDANLTAPPTSPREHIGHLVCAGVDWGRAHDFTAISVLCVHCRAEVALDRWNRVDWAFQRGRILQLCELWNVKYCRVESNSIGGPNLEALQDAAPKGMLFSGFETSGKSKKPLIEALGLALERQTVQWLPDQIARHELLAYEANVTEAGNITYGAPPGGYDDTVICRALALKAARPYLFNFSDEEESAELPEGMQGGRMVDDPLTHFPRRKREKQWSHTAHFWGDSRG